jgi:hypothetical protein
VRFILISGGDPSGQLPLSRLIKGRGDALAHLVEGRFADRPELPRAYNWPDAELSTPPFWADDRLHLNARGHHRVAARVLTALDVEPPADWWSLPVESDAPRPGRLAHAREYVGPWLGRRLTGRSSGDDRVAKHPDWVTVEPTGP